MAPDGPRAATHGMKAQSTEHIAQRAASTEHSKDHNTAQHSTVSNREHIPQSTEPRARSTEHGAKSTGHKAHSTKHRTYTTYDTAAELNTEHAAKHPSHRVNLRLHYENSTIP